jgi:hypothetical protein
MEEDGPIRPISPHTPTSFNYPGECSLDDFDILRGAYAKDLGMEHITKLVANTLVYNEFIRLARVR